MKLKQSILVIGILIAIGVVFVLIKGSINQAGKKPNPQVAIEDSKMDLQNQPTKKPPKLIDLGKGTCIPCIKMKPILDEIAVEYEGRAIVKIIDLKYEPQEARKYRIRLIPTQIFFDSTGKEVYRHEGFMDKTSIKQKLLEMGVK